MSTLTYARWMPPVATTLLELEGCIADFWSAIDFAARLDAAMVSKPIDYVLLDAFSTALIVRYSRSFKQGKRARLEVTPDLRLTDEERRIHERVLAIRDKHTSHPVNRFETQAVYVGFDPSAGDQANVTAVSSGTRTQIPLTVEEVRIVSSLCRKWYAKHRDEQVAECQRLLALAQLLSAGELSRLPVGPVEPNLNPLKERVQAK